MFNVFVFAVLSVLSGVDFSIAAGFGMFAILALFTLRSEPISKLEITNFFGSVGLAVITSVQGATLTFVIATAAFVLAGARLLDHPRILRSVDGIKITFDEIDAKALAEPTAMCAQLARRLGVEVMFYRGMSLDYVNDTARLHVFYRKH